MRKQCRQCRSTTNPEAPYCEACGCVFVPATPVDRQAACWQGRVIAIASGLIVAVFFRLLQG